jgi:putative Holliday junction resolvase
MPRILAIDYGSKNMGIAVSDALGITAQPLVTYKRISPERDVEYVSRLASEYSVGKIVVGLPVHLDGRQSDSSLAARDFGARLTSSAGVGVEYFDERMTTSVIDRMLIEEADVSRAKRKKVRDKLAAVLILQNYLDSKAVPDDDTL